MRIEPAPIFPSLEQTAADLEANRPDTNSARDLNQEAAGISLLSIADRADDQFEKAIYSIALRAGLGGRSVAAPGSTTLATHTDDNSLATRATAGSTHG